MLSRLLFSTAPIDWNVKDQIENQGEFLILFLFNSFYLLLQLEHLHELIRPSPHRSSNRGMPSEGWRWVYFYFLFLILNSLANTFSFFQLDSCGGGDGNWDPQGPASHIQSKTAAEAATEARRVKEVSWFIFTCYFLPSIPQLTHFHFWETARWTRWYHHHLFCFILDWIYSPSIPTYADKTTPPDATRIPFYSSNNWFQIIYEPTNLRVGFVWWIKLYLILLR